MFGLNFLEQGMYGRVACGGLAALSDRQGSRETVITDKLRDCFHLIRAILQLRPERRYWICQPPVLRFIAASDAAEEAPLRGTGGFLVVWQHPRGQLRERFVAADPGSLYSLWCPGEKSDSPAISPQTPVTVTPPTRLDR